MKLIFTENPYYSQIEMPKYIFTSNIGSQAANLCSTSAQAVLMSE